MSEAMAQIIREAMRDHRVSLEMGSGDDVEIVSCCQSCGYLSTELGTHEHQSNIAAEMLEARGFGKLTETVTEWASAFRATGARYNYHRTRDEAEDFVKSMNEVDADMVVITRQHTPATNTEWIPA